MGPSLPTQEVANCSAPKGHMAGFALTESKKETCPQLDQLSYIDNRGVKTDSQIGWVTFPRLHSQLVVESMLSLTL